MVLRTPPGSCVHRDTNSNEKTRLSFAVQIYFFEQPSPTWRGASATSRVSSCLETLDKDRSPEASAVPSLASGDHAAAYNGLPRSQYVQRDPMNYLEPTGMSLECSVPLNIKVSPSRNILHNGGHRIDRGNHIDLYFLLE